MKRKIVYAAMLFVGLLAPIKSIAQSDEIMQLMLNIEKLAQFKQILADMKKGYEILDKGYGSVRELSQGNFTLHQVFLDGLLQVSPTVREYGRIADIIRYQGSLAKEYRAAWDRFLNSGNFDTMETDYLKKVYDRLILESLRNLDNLVNILTADRLRMSDDERLEAIDEIFLDMGDRLSFLRYFNDQVSIMSFHRENGSREIQGSKLIYGLPQ
ncbi:MAG: TerB family tellurite resistance protein [Sediminicola sp.]